MAGCFCSMVMAGRDCHLGQAAVWLCMAASGQVGTQGEWKQAGTGRDSRALFRS